MTLYASTAEIKAALHIPASDTVDDALISMAGSAASELIDGYCNRSFGTVTDQKQNEVVASFLDGYNLNLMGWEV